RDIVELAACMVEPVAEVGLVVHEIAPAARPHPCGEAAERLGARHPEGDVRAVWILVPGAIAEAARPVAGVVAAERGVQRGSEPGRRRGRAVKEEPPDDARDSRLRVSA